MFSCCNFRGRNAKHKLIGGNVNVVKRIEGKKKEGGEVKDGQNLNFLDIHYTNKHIHFCVHGHSSWSMFSSR